MLTASAARRIIRTMINRPSWKLRSKYPDYLTIARDDLAALAKLDDSAPTSTVVATASTSLRAFKETMIERRYVPTNDGQRSVKRKLSPSTSETMRRLAKYSNPKARTKPQDPRKLGR